MEKTAEEISQERITLSNDRIDLEEKRLKLVLLKKPLVKKVIDIDSKLQRINTDLEICKKKNTSRLS